MKEYVFCSNRERYYTHLALKSALKTLRNRKRWTRRSFARDAAGFSVDSRHPSAVCFCSAGAITHAPAADKEYTTREGASVRVYNSAFRVLEKAIGVNNLIEWNDFPGRAHAEVVAAFEKAVEMTTKKNAKVGST